MNIMSGHGKNSQCQHIDHLLYTRKPLMCFVYIDVFNLHDITIK